MIIFSNLKVKASRSRTSCEHCKADDSRLLIRVIFQRCRFIRMPPANREKVNRCLGTSVCCSIHIYDIMTPNLSRSTFCHVLTHIIACLALFTYIETVRRRNPDIPKSISKTSCFLFFFLIFFFAI
jgi:hypothetical protein